MSCSSICRAAARLGRLVAVSTLSVAASAGFVPSAVAQEGPLPSIEEKTQNTDRMEGFFTLYWS